MKKYITVETTNGEGYSEPRITVFTSESRARDYYHQTIGSLLILNDMKVCTANDNKCVLSFGGEDLDDDAEAIFFFELDYLKRYVVQVQPDVCDVCVGEIETTNLIDTIQEMDAVLPFDEDDMEELNGVESISSFGSHTDEGYYYLEII